METQLQDASAECSALSDPQVLRAKRMVPFTGADIGKRRSRLGICT